VVQALKGKQNMGMLFHGDDQNLPMKKQKDPDTNGAWSVRSCTDPRWNKNGRAWIVVCENGPIQMQAWIKKCQKTLGKIPADLRVSYFKD
jgi:hypothetical protein